MKKKRVITFALAAALTLALGAAAYAVWSGAAARQQELKSELGIDENHVISYVEYDLSAEPAGGLVLLAAVSDGQEQRVYVNVSPVTEEEAAAYMEKTWFTLDIDGTTVGGSATPVLPIGSAVASGEMADAVLQEAYDKETQSLTLQGFLFTDSVKQVMEELGADTVPLSVHMFAEGGETRTFGPVSFALTQEQAQIFDFENALCHDEALDLDVELVGLELTPFSAVWKLHYEGDAAVQARKYTDGAANKPWFDLEDRVCQAAAIVFSDGTELSTGGAQNSSYENGVVRLWCGWLRAVDIDDVQRIMLGDQVLWEAE